MPALKPTAWHGRIAWLGHLGDRAAGLASAPAPELALDFAGIVGDAHGGVNRPACSRVAALYPKGTEIRNTRQISIVAAADLAAIARALGLDRLAPSLLGASLVLEDLPDLSRLPPSSRLQGPDGATLVVDMENRPCHLPAREIEAAHPGHGAAFRAAARGRRGVTAWVERPGCLRLGDRLRLFLPDQPAWNPGAEPAEMSPNRP